MNVKKLIEKIEGLNKLYGEKFYVALDDVLDLVKQLDEPQPVKVPLFVVDWIEEARKTCKDVADFFDFDFTNEEVGKWFMQERPFDLVARAWLDGYEVEEEKRYLVKVKGMNRINGCLAYNKKLGTWYFGISGNSKNHSTNHTLKQLEEAGFGWVFDCPGIEIEEVEG